MPNKTFDLSIIILNYNGQFWLKKLLPSIKKNYLNETEKEVEVIVVDNKSTDNSVELLKKDFRWVHLVEASDNGGFAKGNNLGILASNARYLMLLNSDTEFLKRDSNLDPLIDYMNAHSEIAVAGPRLELSDGQLDWAGHRGEPTPWASFCYFAKLEKLFPKLRLFAGYHLKYKNLQEIHSIAACSGAAMLVRHSAQKKIGLLDENFFMYGEDLDWCKRFRDQGFQVIFYPFVTIIHHKYKSGIKSSNRKTSQITRKSFYETMLQYYDKHYRQRYPNIVRWLIRFFIWVKTDAS
jgi:GT2 family glycosyltransferase